MAQLYLNGDIVEEQSARISVFDRGFLFADSVYEVTAIVNGRPIYGAQHYERLQRSCQEMGFASPLTLADFLKIHEDLISANDLDEGIIYLQITRGVAARNFVYSDDIKPTVLAFAKPMNILGHPLAKSGIKIKTTDDLRWARCDIKTTQLTAQSMTKTAAINEGFDDAWMVKDGYVTEGTSNNAFIVDSEGTIITRALSPDILAGVTRSVIIETARSLGYDVEEQAFTVDEVKAANEAFSTSTSTIALPVIAIDGQEIGDGNPGPVCQALRKAFIAGL